jgi:hypothetical protein
MAVVPSGQTYPCLSKGRFAFVPGCGVRGRSGLPDRPASRPRARWGILLDVVHVLDGHASEHLSLGGGDNGFKNRTSPAPPSATRGIPGTVVRVPVENVAQEGGHLVEIYGRWPGRRGPFAAAVWLLTERLVRPQPRHGTRLGSLAIFGDAQSRPVLLADVPDDQLLPPVRRDATDFWRSARNSPRFPGRY